MRVAFLGLGLIGGSIARAAPRRPRRRLVDDRLDAAGAGPRAALAAGAIDDAAGTLEGAVDGADLVVLAAPPTECLALLDELAGPVAAFLGRDAVVTDTASTKGAIVHHATTLGVRFVGGHPMAGRETTGFEAADPMLFRERPWVVVPVRADADAVARVEALATACGANPFTLDARAHDAYVAAISHMPLVVSAALVEAVGGHGRAAAPRLGVGGGARGRRLGLDDAARARRRDDGRGDRRHEPRGDRRAGCATLPRRARRVDRAARGRRRPRRARAARAVRGRPRAARWPATRSGGPGRAGPRRPARVDRAWRRLARRPPRRPRRAALEAVRRDGFFLRRGDAEEDPTHKQVIPYLVLRDGERWFLMRRTRAGGDARLHDLWSIGVGGHLNPGDGDVEGGLRREWAEEVVAGFEPAFEAVGLLNDDTTPVGAVHVGIVFIADAAGRPVEIRETDKLEGRSRRPTRSPPSATRWRRGAGSCSMP